MERTKKTESLSTQLTRRVNTPAPSKKEYDGEFGAVISTGSTLLDLNISGGRIRGGGLPGGILVEIFGPSGSGKTVLLSEIAGSIQRQGGDAMFQDPEARLNPQFAKMFGLELKQGMYSNPNTVPEVFKAVRAWKPAGRKNTIHGIFADSLAALSTDMEMDNDDGDKMGMRRAKEFSEELRKTARILTDKNYLMVCSNQIRENVDPRSFQKFSTPGGLSVGFYSSLRLKTAVVEKIKEKRTIAGKDVERMVGVNIQIEIVKSSIWKPFRLTPVTILFDYGIDDIRQNLQFIKDHTKNTTYTLNGQSLAVSLKEAIVKVETNGGEHDLREEVIELWESIEQRFDSARKPKRP